MEEWFCPTLPTNHVKHYPHAWWRWCPCAACHQSFWLSLPHCNNKPLPLAYKYVNFPPLTSLFYKIFLIWMQYIIKILWVRLKFASTSMDNTSGIRLLLLILCFSCIFGSNIGAIPITSKLKAVFHVILDQLLMILHDIFLSS